MKGTKPEYAVRRGHILSPGRLGAPPGARRGRAACRRVHAAHYEQPQAELQMPHAQNALIGSSARAKRRANDSRRPASWARYILRGYAVHTALLSEARSSALFVSVAADLLLEGVDAVLVL